MSVTSPEFTIGIEEEYLLVDRETRDLVADPPSRLMSDLEEILGGQVSPEFLRSQIEVGTRVCERLDDAAADLARLRLAVSGAAADHGFAIIAASTHPFADWHDQLTTAKERYQGLERDLQAVLRRLVICGMHVHVGIGDADLRVDLMSQVTYFLPHLYALSTSSPFWHGADTGLKSYRKSVFKALPRTGLPPEFSSWAEYQRHVNALVEPGVIDDATRLWWDIRPSARYPTIELRIADICTRLADGVTIAALYLSLLSMLYRRRRQNQRWRTYASLLIEENIWRAQRYGIHGSLVDFGRGELVAFAELVDEIIELVTPDAERLGCLDQVAHARTIVENGTSADRQLDAFAAAVEAGASDREALHAVVDLLIDQTTEGLTAGANTGDGAAD